MKRHVFAAAVLGAAAWLVMSADNASAFGRRSSGGCAPACNTGCVTAYASCGVPGACGPVAGCAPAVTYVEKEIDVWEPKETRTKVKVKVLEPVWVEKNVVVKVPTQKTVKQEVIVNEWRRVEKPVEYVVNQMVCVQEPRKVIKYVTTPREVEVDVTTYTCTTKTVMDTVAVCRRVPVAPACDPCGAMAGCGGCAPACAPACAPSCDSGRRGLLARLCGKRKSDCGTGCGVPCATACAAPACYTTVVEHVQCPRVVTEMIPTKTKVKKIVYDCKAVEDTVMVNVMKCVPTKKQGVQVTCECVPVKKMVDVVVCEWTDRTDKVKVMECKEVEREVDQVTCTMVAVKKKVQVAVVAPCPAPAGVAGCCTPCATPCGGCTAGCGGCDTGCATASCGSDCGGRRGLLGRIFGR